MPAFVRGPAWCLAGKLAPASARWWEAERGIVRAKQKKFRYTLTRNKPARADQFRKAETGSFFDILFIACVYALKDTLRVFQGQLNLFCALSLKIRPVYYIQETEDISDLLMQHL